MLLPVGADAFTSILAMENFLLHEGIKLTEEVKFSLRGPSF